jgi:hypothetical protein
MSKNNRKTKSTPRNSAETFTETINIQPINTIYNSSGEILPSIDKLDPHEIKFDIQYPTERRNSVNSYL